MRKNAFMKAAAAISLAASLTLTPAAAFAAETPLITVTEGDDTETDDLVEYTRVREDDNMEAYIKTNPMARYGSNNLICAPGDRMAFSPSFYPEIGQKLKILITPTTTDVEYEFGYMQGSLDTYCVVSGAGAHTFVIDKTGECIVYMQNHNHFKFIFFDLMFRLS